MQRTENDPADNDCIVSAANYMEVSEYAIFWNAYTEWYGKNASEKQIEKVFVKYLIENKVPFWVRNYARSRIPEEFAIQDQTKEYSRTANRLLYLGTIIAEYILLASYLALR